MDTLSLVVAFVVVWLLTGTITGVWLVRRGHDIRWILIALMLGPIFVPIALERVDREGPRRASQDRTADSWPASGAARVVVGWDGSAQAEAALAAANRLFSATGELVLAEVVPYEAADDPQQSAVSAAWERLSDVVAQSATAPRHEVLVGAPAEALAQLARQVDADVIVVGRRGRGLSRRVLGSVSTSLLEQAPVPVLVVDGDRQA
ncbi:universal stress protein [Mycolicibacterium vaccae]|uniref:universal stress protein n=1 Tax=Mycolicibacterium vaccae TaxID=1810 RepID=UPI003CEF4A63